MKIQFNIEIIKKGKWYIARVFEFDFVTQGATPDEARKNMLELVEIQLNEMKSMGTLKDFLDECGFSSHKRPQFIGIERSELRI